MLKLLGNYALFSNNILPMERPYPLKIQKSPLSYF
jgi:hypothetical protein